MKPIHKFNGGRGATLCHSCSVIISTGLTDDLYCEKCKKMATLELTPEQLEVVRKSLKFYMEVGIGKMHVISEHLTYENYESDESVHFSSKEQADILFYDGRNVILGERMSDNTYLGLHNEKVDNSCRIAFDIFKVIEHEKYKLNKEKTLFNVNSELYTITKDADKIKCSFND